MSDEYLLLLWIAAGPTFYLLCALALIEWLT